MSKKSKLKERLQQRPKDFTWDEACTLMRLCGFTLLKGSGSRRKFVHDATRKKAFIHEPHPQNTLLHYSIKELVEALKDVGELE